MEVWTNCESDVDLAKSCYSTLTISFKQDALILLDKTLIPCYISNKLECVNILRKAKYLWPILSLLLL